MSLIKFRHPAFDCSKLAINWKKMLTLACLFCQFSDWSKFHVNIVTCSGVMTIFVYEGLTRNPEIGNNHICALPNIWRLGRVEDTKFGRNVCNEKLLNVATRQVYNFYRFQVITGNPAGGENTLTRLALINKLQIWDFKAFIFWSKFHFWGLF